MVTIHMRFQDFAHVVDGLKVHVGRPWQGVYLESGNNRYRFNDIVKTFEKVAKDVPASDRCQTVRKIRLLEQQALNQVSSSSFFHKAAMAICEYVGSFFYNRHDALNRLEFPEHILATCKDPYRLMLLNAQYGSVACRVRGESSATIPRLSRQWVSELATRSILRMINLKTSRGETPDAQMMGPCDYFGNLEAPHKHLYTIDIDEDGIPAFLINKAGRQAPTNLGSYTICPQDVSSTVTAHWHKGVRPETKAIQAKYAGSGTPVLGESLFPNAGILEIEGSDRLVLKKFDATKIDLTPFKARLVDNKVPFSITKDPIPSSDDYRAVTYLYEPNYADDVVKNGGGLFLETHQFAQTMTPIDATAGGFVTLGRWVDEKQTQLELIAVEIPFGHTLIVEKDCIHGDTNLAGMFLMCMTSNHVTMNTADTVFLKSPTTVKNYSIEREGGAPTKVSPLQPPVFLSKQATADEKERFGRILKAHNTIFNPFQTI